MVHSEKLEETKIWENYLGKLSSSDKRSGWVKEVFDSAVKYVTDVRKTFQNYTLHDETHILNVMDSMAGLLGDKIGQLTAGELELLILSACLHDLGMVYTDDEKQKNYQDEASCRKFLRKYCPEFLGCPAEEWPEDIGKWYLRTLHPFRLPEVLQNEKWKELFDKRPLDVVPTRCIIAVCQSHGEKPEELSHNSDLEYLHADDADPLFCALLLRLGDLLDFDDTRAPKILYSYVECNDESRAEWDKHQASAGFRYPPSPSYNDLPYKARCVNPGIEHAVRVFLDWIDEELGSCSKLQKRCHVGWQQEFPFPRSVLRDEIESEGYMSGDFCLTMDQTQILKLLTGENLYDNADVFVRELLQNAIDATLLRGEMEPDFIPEKSRIDLWEWNDKEGNIWFRIDDRGTGMTLGMLQRYFLKVGNSYYNSRELERDLRDHGQIDNYHGISRFGIGFLSCFLCGDYAEVSTLYFDSEKNCREEAIVESYQTIHHGLRLQVTGLSGYFTLKNQAKHHQTDGRLPGPGGYSFNAQNNIERDGYRATPGTSIVIRMLPGKLGTLNLRTAAEKYLCGARVPVYYNNERVGVTYEEMMTAAHEAAGEKIYELSPTMKEQFDRSFPAVCGQYPKIAVSVIPLDTEENQVLPELSGVIVKWDVRFDKEPQWKVNDQIYEVFGRFDIIDEKSDIVFISRNKSTVNMYDEWKDLEKKYALEDIAALETEFEKHAVCPNAEDIAEIWKPFSEQMDIYKAWKMYNDNQQVKRVELSTAELQYPDIVKICPEYGTIVCVYQGIVAGDISQYPFPYNNFYALFLMGGTLKPIVDISRSKISALSLNCLLAVTGILSMYQILADIMTKWSVLDGWRNCTLKDLRAMKDSKLDIWLKKNQEAYFIETKRELQKSCKDFKDEKFSFDISCYDNYGVLHMYLMAYFQDTYSLKINYEEGQIISFCEEENNEIDETFALFPPMMFCMAASDQSRRYICSADYQKRRCVTADHPFIIWLLNNAAQLKQYYQRQFQQIVDSLREESARYIVKECNSIREQLKALPERHGVDVSSFPQLSMDDFWVMEEE